ncbi:hypothetical protein AMTR_s00010p00234150 [Amborella trichopoda]|uniref:Uncharacterized protein n=1 Tax=Amborella trichopoda TaxID=13333 RepID=W1NFR1_AMBTC|nr:hypothetical protein AMTR_s00010p00234150 [Amborella trichopoda]
MFHGFHCPKHVDNLRRCHLLHEELKSVIPNLGKIAATYMFGSADARRANPNGPKEKLSFTNLLRVNDEAVDLELQILENFVSKIRNKFKNFLRPRTSLVESFKLVEATDKKENVHAVYTFSTSGLFGRVV